MNAGLARDGGEPRPRADAEEEPARPLGRVRCARPEVPVCRPLDAAAVLEDEYNYILTIGNIIETTREQN